MRRRYEKVTSNHVHHDFIGHFCSIYLLIPNYLINCTTCRIFKSKLAQETRM